MLYHPNVNQANKQFEKGGSVERLGCWIDPPQWKARYEETTYSRNPGTGEWILQEPVYRSWRSQEEMDQTVLFINGWSPAFIIKDYH